MSTTTTTTESRALDLLGQGLGPESVASAVGVSVSRISQLLSDPEFSSKVAEQRFENLAKHSKRDNKYDTLEDTLIDKLSDCLPYMIRPMEILKSIQVINSAKRRGASAPEAIHNQATVVQLVLPTQIFQNFTTNINNQVIKAGNQDLVTVQSASMNNLLAKMKGAQNVQTPIEIGNSPSGASS